MSASIGRVLAKGLTSKKPPMYASIDSDDVWIACWEVINFLSNVISILTFVFAVAEFVTILVLKIVVDGGLAQCFSSIGLLAISGMVVTLNVIQLGTSCGKLRTHTSAVRQIRIQTWTAVLETLLSLSALVLAIAQVAETPLACASAKASLAFNAIFIFESGITLLFWLGCLWLVQHQDECPLPNLRSIANRGIARRLGFEAIFIAQHSAVKGGLGAKTPATVDPMSSALIRHED